MPKTSVIVILQLFSENEIFLQLHCGIRLYNMHMGSKKVTHDVVKACFWNN